MTQQCLPFPFELVHPTPTTVAVEYPPQSYRVGYPKTRCDICNGELKERRVHMHSEHQSFTLCERPACTARFFADDAS